MKNTYFVKYIVFCSYFSMLTSIFFCVNFFIFCMQVIVQRFDHCQFHWHHNDSRYILRHRKNTYTEKKITIGNNFFFNHVQHMQYISRGQALKCRHWIHQARSHLTAHCKQMTDHQIKRNLGKITILANVNSISSNAMAKTLLAESSFNRKKKRFNTSSYQCNNMSA